MRANAISGKEPAYASRPFGLLSFFSRVCSIPLNAVFRTILVLMGNSMEQTLFDKIQAAQKMHTEEHLTDAEYWDVLFDILMSDKHADFLEDQPTV